MMTVKVREAQDSDAASLIALAREADPEGETTGDLDDVISQIGRNPTERILIARIDEVMVGFATVQVTRSFAYHRPTAEVTEIYISPLYRRRGAATALLGRAKSLAESESALELFLRVNHSNSRAIAVYEAEGMQRAEHYVYRYRYY